MHNTILNYLLNIVEKQVLPMPAGAKIISAQTIRGKISLCAMIDTAAKAEPRTIAVIGTGNTLPKINPDETLQHIDTVQLHGMVWHVFEIVQKEADDLKDMA